MPRQHFANNAFSTLSVAVSSNTQASLTLQTGHGARFPQIGGQNYFMVTLDDGTNVEICKCVAVSGDVLTVLRGYERTTAQASFATGTRVQLRVTVDGLRYQRENPAQRLCFYRSAIGVASWQVIGTTVPTDVNSRIAGTLTNSSYREAQPRIRHACANSAQNPIAHRVAQASLSPGQGFRYLHRFGFAAAPNSSHFFVGLVNTTGSFTSVHPPSSLVSAFVVGYANGGLDSELSIWRNDASGNAAQLALGSYFTVRTTAWYEFEVEADPSTPTVFQYAVRRLDISSIADAASYFTTDNPGSSLWLSPHMAGATMVTSGIAVENGGATWMI